MIGLPCPSCGADDLRQMGHVLGHQVAICRGCNVLVEEVHEARLLHSAAVERALLRNYFSNGAVRVKIKRSRKAKV